MKMMTGLGDLRPAQPTKVVVFPPSLNLRKAAQYNSAVDRFTPRSATSACFSFNQFLLSPPLSPGLPPPLILRRRKARPARAQTARLFRLIVYLSGVILTIFLFAALLFKPSVDTAVSRNELIIRVPDVPSVVILPSVVPRLGRRRGPAWTVLIPSDYPFPLSTDQYVRLCASCREAEAATQGPGSDSEKRSSAHFLDVREVTDAGLLADVLPLDTGRHTDHDSRGVGEGELIRARDGDQYSVTMGLPVCSRSLTVVLESTDAGLGNGLMMLWTMYGIAERQGRAFFLDDSRWIYGRYSDLFQPPLQPGCRPPPRRELIPCPASARHLVVSAATAVDAFPDVFAGDSAVVSSFSGSSGHKTDQFALVRRGYEALFRLIDEDADHVRTRIRDIDAAAAAGLANDDENSGSGQGHGHDGRSAVIGVHVRRGDRHPLEFQYRDSYIPPNLFAERAREMARGSRAMMVALASDDPTVYELDDFAGAVRAQERIQLASKSVIQQANPDGSGSGSGSGGGGSGGGFVDETVGWEGGFFSDMFRNLGPSGGSLADETGRLRVLVGRAYVMDLAVLASATDAVVCAVSATGCRILAVAMGADRAFAERRWANIDGGYGWFGADL